MKTVPNLSVSSLGNIMRMRLLIKGLVQGVGFRPFIYKLAKELKLNGWVSNSAQGVIVDAEGTRAQLETLIKRIKEEKPPRSSISNFEYFFLDQVGHFGFEIRESDVAGDTTTPILPDIAACPECLREVFDPRNRRYLYPFTNCTHCGPRFTVIESLPYDRIHTSMKMFKMCPRCDQEYKNPLDRRFHAQPNACPVCGPHLELWDNNGKFLSAYHEALQEAARAIKQGKIVALKGLGGFHLLCDARDEEGVRTLRKRKHREEKPFALMFPALSSIEEECFVSELEKQILLSFESPIVLLKRKVNEEDSYIARSVAPGNPYLGVMLAYTPLHHILMKELDFPVVATSGNLSDEPICTDEKEALVRLRGIADVFLVHNRPIVRPMDDSVVRLMMDRPLIVRRARGYAPFPVSLTHSVPGILAVGGHLKNTVALSVKDNIFVSQHIGDLATQGASLAFSRTVDDLCQLYHSPIERVACDMHPDYLSTKCAKNYGVPVVAVQHHHAHVVSCMVENEITQDVLGVSWDGTGFGTDGTIWGGEFLISSLSSFKRAGYFRTFGLPGGDKAIQEPCRSALSVLYEVFGEKIFKRRDLFPVAAFSDSELSVLKQMITKKINCPRTSSVGRLFDAVSSIIGLRQHAGFEGQAAMSLEYVLENSVTRKEYPFDILESIRENDAHNAKVFIVDWSAVIEGITEDVKCRIAPKEISAKFHNTLVRIIVDMAKKILTLPDAPQSFKKEKRVCLSGGCFQNKYLAEHAIFELKKEGFEPYWHQRLSPNDGGISVGQVMVAASLPKEKV